MKKYTASNHYLCALLKQAALKGVDIDNLLHKTNISPELRGSPQARIAVDELVKLIQALWKSLNDEYLGFTKHPCNLGTFYLMGKLTLHEPNLEKALKIATRYYRTIHTDYGVELIQQDDEARLIFTFHHPELDPDHLLSEFVMIVWHRFFSWLLGKHILLSQSTFNYPAPVHVDEYKFFFPGRQYFAQSAHSLIFHKQYLQSPVIQTEKTLKDFFRRTPVDLFLKPENDDSYSTRIRLMIESKIEDGFPDFTVIANAFNMAPQTLRRKLGYEGTPYQSIKDTIRRDVAIFHLTQRNLPINEIASKVGFTEPGAFIRAFKGWTGVTPGDYRRID
ncbi:AraC family transcriptional regulator [Pseudomonas sp. 25 R 14]|uniref:AraC family transcriptional regulator n=1 Tax=Pseudomonas sp. 25 R 14 TaxID=1844109 RepID=UPI0008122312|nr:AraC family transcriptional regulator [Pseudomonas sp. 25 R 14]CRM75435.1 Virulence-regulating protein VirS [Pseudomonas sp. 25 R 14]